MSENNINGFISGNIEGSIIQLTGQQFKIVQGRIRILYSPRLGMEYKEKLDIEKMEAIVNLMNEKQTINTKYWKMIWNPRADFMK